MAFEKQLKNYSELDSNKKVLEVVQRCLSFSRTNKLIELESFALLEQARVYKKIGKGDDAFKIAYQIVRLGERNKNKNIVINGREFLGNLHILFSDLKKALAEYKKSEQLYIELGKINSKEYYQLKGTIGMLYSQSLPNQSAKDYDTSILFIQSEISHYQKTNNISKDLGDAYVNLGSVYVTLYITFQRKEDLDNALKYQYNAIEIYKKNNSKKNIGPILTNIGIAYYNAQDFKKSMNCFKKAETYALETGDLRTLAIVYDHIRYLHELKGDFKTAYDYREEWVSISDSINKQDISKNAENLQVRYDFDKKEQEISSLEKDKKIQTKEVERQKTVRNSLIGGFVLVALFVLVLINRFVFIRKQKAIIEEQKAFVDHKNKEVTDSINYAQRIQQALMLRDETESSKQLETFILFQPKDIVSGDFYWSLEKQGFLYVAVADCTGHGVPGAFLTMLGTSYLNEINSSESCLSPAEILDALRLRFMKELSQSGKEGESKDGMDISLVRIEMETRNVNWAGANNPFWCIQHQSLELLEIKPDKQPIGYADRITPFTNHSISLQKNDTIYLFSDGYADQFGGPKGKKLKASLLKEELLKMTAKSLDEQKTILSDLFQHWKGNLEQVDDVCVMGLRM